MGVRAFGGADRCRAPGNGALSLPCWRCSADRWRTVLAAFPRIAEILVAGARGFRRWADGDLSRYSARERALPGPEDYRCAGRLSQCLAHVNLSGYQPGGRDRLRIVRPGSRLAFREARTTAIARACLRHRRMDPVAGNWHVRLVHAFTLFARPPWLLPDVRLCGAGVLDDKLQ